MGVKYVQGFVKVALFHFPKRLPLALSLLVSGCLGVSVTDLDPNDFLDNENSTGDQIFTQTIEPIFARQGCAAAGSCHAPDNTQTPPLPAQGGMDLSLSGQELYDQIVPDRVNLDTPEESLILAKPFVGSSVLHDGGKSFFDQSPSNSDYQTLLAWLQDGAKFDSESNGGGNGESASLCKLSTAVSLTNDVIPIFSAGGPGCIGCHDAGTAAGGLDLSSTDPTALLAEMNSEGVLDTTNPVESLLITKPSLGAFSSSSVAHGGGQKTGFVNEDDTEYQTILCWIEDGAQNN